MQTCLMNLASVAVVLIGAGCAHLGTTVWTDPRVETIRFDTAGLSTVEVRTHNGAVEFQGQDQEAEAVVTVKKKGGARTQEDAEAALSAIEIVNRRSDDGVHHLGWKWSGHHELSWNAEVSFSITAPGRLRLDAETHNGEMRVKGATAEVKLATHNGGIDVTSSRGKLSATTHNGAISAKYQGSDINLSTHNGEVEADLTACGAIGGRVDTHNGAVTLTVSEKTSAELACTTHNGRIAPASGVSMVSASAAPRTLKQTLGAGGPALRATTHNGKIQVVGPK